MCIRDRRYDWEWDKVPTGLGEDGVALTYYGIDANNDGFNIRLASYESEVNYYTCLLYTSSATMKLLAWNWARGVAAHRSRIQRARCFST